MIRAATTADCEAVAAIYNHYVMKTIVTFEEEPVAPAEIAGRLQEVASASMPWLVAEQSGDVVGYAYSNQWKGRHGYRFSAEITVYISPDHSRRGLGSALYDHLFPLLMARGIHAVMGGIALPNEASVALHERFGLEKVAHFREVGFKFDRWIDVGYWQRTL